jgi:hypothetical protein
MWIWYVLGTLTLLISAVLIAVYHHPRFKMTSFADGTVLRSERREIRTPHERFEQTEVVCSYRVNGRNYEMTRQLRNVPPSRFPVGATVPVRYYPADPTVADLA